MKSEIDFFKHNGYMRFPKLLQIEITNRCPLSCPQCYKSPNGERDIDFGTLSKVMENAARCNVRYIMINGGEPLLYHKFADFLHLIKEYNFEASCVTSGIGLTEELLSSIKNSGCYLQLNVSMNGSTEKVNSLSRDGYTHSIKAIELLCKNRFSYGINWVARNDNIYDLPNLVKLAKSYNAGWVTIVTGKIDFEGRETSNLSQDDYIYLSGYIKQNEDSRFFMVQYCFPFLNSILYKNMNVHRNQCNAGIYSCCIDSDGKFSPCIHLNYKEDFDSIEEYWSKSEILRKIRNPEFGDFNDCKGCAARDSCRNCFCMDKENSDGLLLGFKKCPIKNIINKGDKDVEELQTIPV